MVLKSGFLGRIRGGSNYPYVTARVRAKKTKLVPREEYKKLVAMDAHEIARYLEEGEYKSQVLDLADKYSGALLVETATRLNLSETYRDIVDLSRGELKQLLLLYLQRYDVYNVKTVLRGRFAGASEDEITRTLIPAGALSVDELGELTRLAGFPEVLEALKRTPYGAVLADAPAAPERLTEIENALDRLYYSALLDAVPANNHANRAFRDFVKTEVDVLNLKTILRLRAADVEDASDVLLPGGREINEERARRLLRANPQEFASEIEGTRLAPTLDGIRVTLESGDVNPAMNALERFLVDMARPFSERYPLSILPIIDFILRKRREVDNLRIIAYGKATGLPEETIDNLVVT